METCDLIASLRGERVESATVVEMALVKGGPNGQPIFRHSSAPFIQAIQIELALDSGRFALFSNYQNDDTSDGFTDFPIGMDLLTESLIKPEKPYWEEVLRDGEFSIYRLAPHPNFPLGLITDAKAILNANGDIAEIAIEVGGQPTLLFAGEVMEDQNDTFGICELAGSILLFPNPEDRQRTNFNEAVSWR